MPNISDVLTSLNSNYTDINSLVPSRFDFTDYGTTNLSILDGGFDMYDTANYLYTNLFSQIPYTHTQQASTNTYGVNFVFIGNGSVTSGTNYFGEGSSYFTNMYPGLFVMAATNINITQFRIDGNIGTDGGGLVTTDDFTSGGYSVFRKSVYNTSDPSINHIILMPGTDLGVTHTWDTSRQSDTNTHSNIPPSVDHIYYILVARTSGQLLAHDDAENIVTAFLETAGGISNNTITQTSIDSIESISQATLKQTLFVVTPIASNETLPNVTASLSVQQTSISSEENINQITLTQNVSANSISSVENISTDSELSLSITVDSITSDESVTGLQSKLTIEDVGDITTEESVSNTEVKYALGVSISSSETFSSPNVLNTIQTGVISSQQLPSQETFGVPDIGRFLYVLPMPFCPGNSKNSCSSKKSALVPSITVMNDVLYLRDHKPIPIRRRLGRYIRHI